MTKLGNIIASFRSNSFASALKDVRENYTKFLSDEDLVALESVDAIRAEKDAAYDEAIKSLMKEGACLGSMSTYGRSHRLITKPIATILEDGSVKLSSSAGALDSLTVFWDSKENLAANMKYRGINNSLYDSLSSRKECLFTTEAGLQAYKNIYDIENSFNLSEIIENIKAERKANRTNRAVTCRTEKVFHTSNGAKTYDELKAWLAQENKIGVLEVRTKSYMNRGYSVYAVFDVPKTEQDEKNFKVGDVTMRSVYDSPREVADRLEKTDCTFIKILAGDYKRLKLWNDDELVLEQDYIGKMLNDLVKGAKGHTFKTYCDSLLCGSTDVVKCLFDAMSENAPQGGKSSRFYKLYKKAVDKLCADEEILNSANYTNFSNRDRWFKDYNVKNPIKKEFISKPLFKDYPLVKYYGPTYSSNITCYRDNTDLLNEIWQYVMTVEKASAK